VALAVGLAILGTVTWALSGALGGGTSNNAADVGHATGTHRTSTAAGRQASAGAPAPGTAAPVASASGTPSPSPSASATGPAAPRAGHTRAPAPGPPACPPGDVVLSVFASQASYGAGQPPEFDVDVVSVADRSCAFNVGPRHLELVITAGRKRVWGSADCAAAPGSLVTDLARGVPAILPVTWDLQTSAPGCAAAARQAAAGSYAATASDGGVISNPVTFGVS